MAPKMARGACGRVRVPTLGYGSLALGLQALALLGVSQSLASANPQAIGLSDQLRTEAKASPILFVVGERGVVARSVDGRVDRPIVSGEIEQAILDAELELLWVVRTDRLEILDLREPAPNPVLIVSNMNPDAELMIERKALGLSPTMPTNTCDINSAVRIQLGPKPSLEVIGDRNKNAPPTLVGAAWIASQSRRQPRTSTRIERTTFPSARATLPLPTSVAKCGDEPTLCGQSVPFGATGYHLVFAGEDEGADCRHYRCLILDPSSKKTGKPPVPKSWSKTITQKSVGLCGPYRFAPSGKTFLTKNQQCTKTKCIELGGTAIGWLDGELVVDIP